MMRKTPGITHVATTDLSELLDPGTEPRQDLPGFDPEFVDFPDYIIRITDRIWHDRDVELIHRYYAPDCIVHTQAGTVIGVDPVLSGTKATMVSFPDRRLEADNVIWSQEPPMPGSPNPVFYSSHLITSKMTNTGESEFGPATDKRIRVITIADCLCRDNAIFEEWLVRDYAAILAQMDLDIDATARKFAAADRAMGLDLVSLHAANHARVRAGEHRDPGLSDWSGWAREVLPALWEDGADATLRGLYDFRVGARFPWGRDLYGPDDVGDVIRAVKTAMPDLRVCVDHVCAVPYLGGAVDVAVRWSLAGHHTGDGWLGDATGLPVYILGISQFRVIRGRIREEVTVWDDFAVRRMIEAGRDA